MPEMHLMHMLTKLSFRSKRTRREGQAYTEEVEKQQFVCSRFKKPPSEVVDVEKLINQSYVDESDCESDAGKSRHSKTCSKRSGSSMSNNPEKKKRRQTNCKARMVIKHIGAR